MRIITTGVLAASLALHLGIAAADTDPSSPAGALPRPPAPTVDPALAGPQLRPTAPVVQMMLLPAVQAARESARQAAGDEAMDQLLGALPASSAAADSQGARHIYVDENGDLACVTLDTFFPEPC